MDTNSVNTNEHRKTDSKETINSSLSTISIATIPSTPSVPSVPSVPTLPGSTTAKVDTLPVLDNASRVEVKEIENKTLNTESEALKKELSRDEKMQLIEKARQLVVDNAIKARDAAMEGIEPK